MAIWFQIRKIPDPYQYVREREKAVFAACEALREGGLVVFPTETVYGIGCDALNENAVRALFEKKKRPSDKPLLLHLHDRRQAEKAACLSAQAEALMERFCPGPLSLVVPKKACVPDSVTGGLDTVGLRFPSHPFFREMAAAFDGIIAATSANLSGLPSAKDSAELTELDDIADVIIDAGPTEWRLESTVVSLTGEKPAVLRQGAVTVEQLREVIDL